ncbi:MAG: response regulator [Bacteroidota bacterium]
MLTTIIIDDSTLQRLATTRFVGDHPELNLIGTYSDARVGLEAANSLKPDLLILDVEMPELGGFDVLSKLTHDCQVILYSTRSQFALEAFQYTQVKDFLMKPMYKPRFEKSIERILKNSVSQLREPRTLGSFVEVTSWSIAS